MRILRLSRHAAGALWSQKLKAFLMMVGTAVGILLLTAVVGLSQGVERRIAEIARFFGPTGVMVFGGGGSRRGPHGGGGTSSLTEEDLAAIRQRFSDRAIISATIRMQGNLKAGDQEAQTSVFAADAQFCQAFDWYVASGAPLDEEDERSRARTCMLGATTARTLFGEEDPVGKKLLLNKVQFRVKGVLSAKGANPMGFDMDDRVQVPLSTGMKRLARKDRLDMIRVKVREEADFKGAAEELGALLRERHRIGPNDEDNFTIRTPDDAARRAREMSATARWVGAALAAVALLVGGVVLMNILLLSVSERTPEIGLKRATGARERDILVEFLAESVLVCLFGMALGIALGLVPVFLLPKLFPMMPMAVTWRTFAYAGLFSVAVGLLFGVQPARRAARLNPIEALR